MSNDKDKVEKINKDLKDKHAFGHATDKNALAKIRDRTEAGKEGNGSKKGKS